MGSKIKERYSEVTFISQGAFGEIKTAYDKVIDKKVALKFLKKTYLNKINIEQLKREFYLLSKNESPFVAKVYDFFHDDDQPFFSMEFIEGKSLDFLLRENPSSIDKEKYIIEIALALEHIHSNGIVHGDLKPENIIIGSEHLKIIDFGLSSDIEDKNLSYSGSLGWIAPEKLMGFDSGVLSDIYSYAVIVYELLTGKNPFIGASAQETIDRQLNHVVQIAEDIDVGNRDALTYLSKMLDKDPYARPSSTYFFRNSFAKDVRPASLIVNSKRFLNKGNAFVDSYANSILEDLSKTNEKVLYKIVLHDKERFKRFLKVLKPKLKINGYIDITISDLYSSLKNIFELFFIDDFKKCFDSFFKIFDISAEDLIDNKVLHKFSRTDIVNSLVNLIEKLSEIKPVFLNLCDCSDLTLKNRFCHSKNGNIVIFSDVGEIFEFLPLTPPECLSYLKSVLNPMLNVEFLSNYVYYRTGGVLEQIDLILGRLVDSESLLQKPSGWFFKEPVLDISIENYEDFSEYQRNILTVLSLYKTGLTADLLKNIIGAEEFYLEISELIRLGIVDEKYENGINRYYLRNESICRKIDYKEFSELLERIFEVVDENEHNEPDIYVEQIKLQMLLDSEEVENYSEQVIKHLKSIND